MYNKFGEIQYQVILILSQIGRLSEVISRHFLAFHKQHRIFHPIGMQNAFTKRSWTIVVVL